jgi:putative peptidoglycan lipid II flippase
MLVRRPLVAVIFERGEFSAADTILTSRILWFYCLGLCGFFFQQIVARAFFSMQDCRTPAATAAVAVLFNIGLNLTLVWFIGTGGLALSTALCSYLQVLLLLSVLVRRFGRSMLDGLMSSAARTLMATLLCWLVGAGILDLLGDLPAGAGGNLIRLAATVPACIAAFAVAARLLGLEVFSLITGRKSESRAG